MTREILIDAPSGARQLLGFKLARNTPQGKMVGRIVETEAYSAEDAASHSFRGQTPRNSVMFGPAGFAYVYFTYGMHYCLNIVSGTDGHGQAVLIRALEPLEGINIMQQNRHLQGVTLKMKELTNGPAKLCQALKIDKSLNGHDITMPPLLLLPGELVPNSQVVQTTRIGITNDTHRKWRFYIKNNPFVSKPISGSRRRLRSS